MIKAKSRVMIKGEMRMIEIKEKHHHIQECIKIFKRDHLIENILGDI
jgi:hypothetical protein